MSLLRKVGVEGILILRLRKLAVTKFVHPWGFPPHRAPPDTLPYAPITIPAYWLVRRHHTRASIHREPLAPLQTILAREPETSAWARGILGCTKSEHWDGYLVSETKQTERQRRVKISATG